MFTRRVITLSIMLLFATVALTGCTPVEEQDTVSALEAALKSLMQNRALVEQFGRDIKTSVDPTDPHYADLMESYEEARDSYNHFLDVVELEVAARHPKTELEPSVKAAQDATASFLAEATRTLKPHSTLRGEAFQRAIVIPDNLAIQLRRLPKSDRREIISRFSEPVRVRAWGQL